MKGAYEYYLRTMTDEQKADLMQSIERQKADADRMQTLRMDVLKGVLSELWSEDQTRG